ncbi:hypothetical protein QBA75_40055 [Streptomyces stelliscabiei]
MARAAVLLRDGRLEAYVEARTGAPALDPREVRPSCPAPSPRTCSPPASTSSPPSL